MRTSWEKIVGRVRSAFDIQDADRKSADRVISVFMEELGKQLNDSGPFREQVREMVQRHCHREEWNVPIAEVVHRLIHRFDIPSEGLEQVCWATQEMMNVFHRLAMGDEAFRGILLDHLAEPTTRR